MDVILILFIGFISVVNFNLFCIVIICLFMIKIWNNNCRINFIVSFIIICWVIIKKECSESSFIIGIGLIRGVIIKVIVKVRFRCMCMGISCVFKMGIMVKKVLMW